MSEINFATAQIIVENAMRAEGYGGSITKNNQTINLETAWTDSFPINYQSLRDAIAKSIVDALTATEVTGNISNGSTTAPNQQVVTASPSVNINITNPAETPLKGAARFGDTVTITPLSDPAFFAWVAAVSSVCSVPPIVLATGKVTSSSSTVSIGD
jgi:hypothetical protein